MRSQPGRRSSIAHLAREAITKYTDEQSLLLDPICGSGDILVEAVRAGRMAIGFEHEPYWAEMARNRIERATDSGRGGFAAVVNGSIDTFIRLLTDEASPQPVSMVLTAPQIGTTVRADGIETAATLADFIEGSVSAATRCTQVTTAKSLYGIISWPTPGFDTPDALKERFTIAGFKLVANQMSSDRDTRLLLFSEPDLRDESNCGRSEQLPGSTEIAA